jgi:hypothetical protein
VRDECGSVVVALALLMLGLLVLATPTQATDDRITVPPDDRHVLQGEDVVLNVTFLPSQGNETITVECELSACTEWERNVEYDPDKSNCSFTAPRWCHFTFPKGFEPTDGAGESASEVGEPSFASTYEAGLSGVSGEEFEAEFDAHLSTADSCRDSVVRRGETLRITTTGRPDGETFDVFVKDDGKELYKTTKTSAGKDVPYTFYWSVPLDLPLADDESREVEVQISSPSGTSEREQIAIKPGVATPTPVAFPSSEDQSFFERGILGQDLEFNRTESLKVWLKYTFLAGPRNCENLSIDRPAFTSTVKSANVQGERLDADIRRHQNVSDSDNSTEIVDGAEAPFAPGAQLFTFNYTIPRDERVTEESSNSPEYDLKVERQKLGDGNYVGNYNSSDHRVFPLTIEPEFEVLQDEVERLETAELVMNLTYADGSPFKPQDTSEDLNVEFAQPGDPPIETLRATYRGNGLWNVSKSLSFEHEPLGQYEWRVQGVEDDYGQTPNTVEDKITPLFDVVSARPFLNLTTLVGDTPSSSAQRTEKVHVNLQTQFRDGTPLSPENVDEEIGAIQLDVIKRNDFGRVVDQDRMLMESINDEGSWVRTFRIGNEPSQAPTGTWDLEITAKDNRTPANINVSSFPLDVKAANITVSDVAAPPPLVDTDQLTYTFRLTYADGTRAGEAALDESRGGRLDVRLERPALFGEGAVVERQLDARPIDDGQKWRAQIDTSRLVPGNHFINVTGQDIHGNPIPSQATDLFTVLFDGEFRNSTTRICANASLSPDERCEVERGDEVYAVFPGAEGDTGMTTENVSIRVHRQVPGEDRWILVSTDARVSPEKFFEERGESVGNDHVGRFQTTESTPLGVYRLAILGRDSEGHGFAGFTQEFNVTRTVASRDIVQPFPETIDKQEEVTATIEQENGDVVEEAIVTSGDVRSRAVQARETGLGTFLTWTPPRSFPSGEASMEVRGEDLFGNPFEVTLGPFEIKPLTINVTAETDPPDSARRGLAYQFPAGITYETGTGLRGQDGRPDVRIVDSDGVTVDTGNAVFPNRQPWEIQWFPNATLPRDDYFLEVTGTDRFGNEVNEFRTGPIDLQPGTVSGETVDDVTDIRRGDTATANFRFAAEPETIEAITTTGGTRLDDPRVRVDGRQVDLVFPTDKRTGTPGVSARLELTGEDILGNEIEARTDDFNIVPLQLRVNILDEPPDTVRTGQTVRSAFAIEYPNDASRMTEAEGSPIVGVFFGDSPAGPIEPEPVPDEPGVWRVEWTPPEDAQTDVPYRFSISALDRWENEARAASTSGFFIRNPVIPDYMPVPGPGPAAALLAMAAAAAGTLTRQRSRL